MRIVIHKKNPLVPEPELEIDELYLESENDADRELLQKLIDQFEISGCGFGIFPYEPLHVCLKLERKHENVPNEEIGLFDLDGSCMLCNDKPTTGGGTPEA